MTEFRKLSSDQLWESVQLPPKLAAIRSECRTALVKQSDVREAIEWDPIWRISQTGGRAIRFLFDGARPAKEARPLDYITLTVPCLSAEKPPTVFRFPA